MKDFRYQVLIVILVVRGIEDAGCWSWSWTTATAWRVSARALGGAFPEN